MYMTCGIWVRKRRDILINEKIMPELGITHAQNGTDKFNWEISTVTALWKDPSPLKETVNAENCTVYS